MKLRKDLMKSRTRLFLFCLFAGLGYLPSKTSGQVLFGECSAVLQRSVEQGVSGSAVGLIARGDQILWLGAAGEISPGEPMPGSGEGKTTNGEQ